MRPHLVPLAESGLACSQAVSVDYAFVDLDMDDAVTPGVFTVQPAHVYGSTDNGNFYLINRIGSYTYRLWEITGHPAAPTVVSNAPRVWVAGNQVLAGAPQTGTSVTLDPVSGRVMNARLSRRPLLADPDLRYGFRREDGSLVGEDRH